MRRIFALLVIVSFLLSGCASTPTEHVKVYKFKKDRVDQTIRGNRGYIVGKSDMPVAERKAERTLIGVDIDLPAELFPPFGKDLEEEAVVGEEVSEAAVPKSAEKVEKVEEEEEWIK